MKAFLISIFGKSSGMAAVWQSHAGLAEVQPAEGMGSEGCGCLENFPRDIPQNSLSFSAWMHKVISKNLHCWESSDGLSQNQIKI